jgi:hypothetical protein
MFSTAEAGGEIDHDAGLSQLVLALPLPHPCGGIS